MADMTQFLQEVTKAFETSKNIPKDELIFTYDGVLYPTATCDMDTFKALETFETREDDVMLAAYPKCGSNWTTMLLHSIVHAVHNKHPSAIIPMIEFKFPDKFEGKLETGKIIFQELKVKKWMLNLKRACQEQTLGMF
ncbi:sulfotransferase 6B1-like isoform X3 [Aquarana catesbeiana]|uniref:sulfotransferase 6B1-like isoform X3 n=1 Tax=Aquarana catesbeiana TaxID=8400 RepID=UPI003CC98B02